MTDEKKTAEDQAAAQDPKPEDPTTEGQTPEGQTPPADPTPPEDPKPAPKPRKKAAAKQSPAGVVDVEVGSEVDLGDKPGHLCFPDGGVSSHKGPARFTVAGDYRFVTSAGETTYRVK